MQELFEDEGNLEVLFKIFWRLPLIFIATMVVRAVSIALFNPLFKLAKSGELSKLSSSRPWCMCRTIRQSCGKYTFQPDEANRRAVCGRQR